MNTTNVRTRTKRKSNDANEHTPNEVSTSNKRANESVEGERHCSVKYYHPESPSATSRRPAAINGGSVHDIRVKNNIGRLECLLLLREIAKNWKQYSGRVNRATLDTFKQRLFSLFLNYETLSVDYFMTVIVSMRNTLPVGRFLDVLSEAYALNERVLVEYAVSGGDADTPPTSQSTELHLFLMCVIKTICDSFSAFKSTDLNLLDVSEKCFVEHYINRVEHRNVCILQIMCNATDALMMQGSEYCFATIHSIWSTILDHRTGRSSTVELEEALVPYANFKVIYEIVFPILGCHRSEPRMAKSSSERRRNPPRTGTGFGRKSMNRNARNYKSPMMENIWRSLMRDRAVNKTRDDSYRTDELLSVTLQKIRIRDVHRDEIDSCNASEERIVRSIATLERSNSNESVCPRSISIYRSTFNLLKLQTRIMSNNEVVSYCRNHMFNIMYEHKRNSHQRWYNVINDENACDAMYHRELSDWKGAVSSSSAAGTTGSAAAAATTATGSSASTLAFNRNNYEIDSLFKFINTLRRNVLLRWTPHLDEKNKVYRCNGERQQTVAVCTDRDGRSFRLQPFTLNDFVHCVLRYILGVDDALESNDDYEAFLRIIAEDDEHERLQPRYQTSLDGDGDSFYTVREMSIGNVARVSGKGAPIIPTRVMRTKQRLSMRANNQRGGGCGAAENKKSKDDAAMTNRPSVGRVRRVNESGSVIEFVFRKMTSAARGAHAGSTFNDDNLKRLECLREFYSQWRWPAVTHNSGTVKLPVKFLIFANHAESNSITAVNFSTRDAVRLLHMYRESTLHALGLIMQLLDPRRTGRLPYDIAGSEIIRAADSKIEYYAYMFDTSNIRVNRITVLQKNVYTALLQTLFMVGIQHATSQSIQRFNNGWKDDSDNANESVFGDNGFSRPHRDAPLTVTLDFRKSIMSSERYDELCLEMRSTSTDASTPFGVNLKANYRLVEIALDSYRNLLKVHKCAMFNSNLTVVIRPARRRSLSLSDVVYLIPMHFRHELESFCDGDALPPPEHCHYSWDGDVTLVHDYGTPIALKERCRVDVITGKRILAACVSMYLIHLRALSIVEDGSSSIARDNDDGDVATNGRQLFDVVCETVVNAVLSDGIKMDNWRCEIKRIDRILDAAWTFIASVGPVGVQFVEMYKHFTMEIFQKTYSELVLDIFSCNSVSNDARKRQNVARMYKAIDDSFEFVLMCFCNDNKV